MRPGAALLLSLLPSAWACRSYERVPADVPVVEVETTRGRELGATTDQGVLFLGRTAQEGPARVLYWLGPSPLVEAGAIRRLGGPFWEVMLEVEPPVLPISFEELQPGEQLTLWTVEDRQPRSYTVQVPIRSELRGTVVTWPSGFESRPGLVGAPVVRETPLGPALVGFVKATARLQDGLEERGYLLLAGLPEIRLAFLEPVPAVDREAIHYRADGLRVIRRH